MRHQVTITDTGEQYPCDEQESLLVAMARCGRRGIPLGCRGGGCGVCKVKVEAGDVTLRPMSRQHVSAEDEAAGRVLACRIFPRGDVELSVIGLLNRAVCGTRRVASANDARVCGTTGEAP